MVGLEKEILIDIATRLSGLIKHNVNIFDVNGIIVGSSDLSRVGKYHAFAHSIIKGEVKNYAVYESESSNVKPGINLPVHSEGKVIGAVGITGNPDEVGVFSEILKLSLESLITQQFVAKKKSDIDKYEKQVVLEILFDLINSDLINRKLQAMNFIREEFNLIVKFIKPNAKISGLLEGVSFIKASMNDKKIVIITSDSEEKISKIIDNIEKSGHKAIISRIIDFSKVALEYKIINYIEKYRITNKQLYLCKEHRLDYFFFKLNKSDSNLSNFFTEGIELNNNELLVKTFDSFIKNKLSLSKSADDLFIHVNTLKYRLKRIEEITSCNLKDIDDLIKIRLSLLSIQTKY
ncbi:helix-turn-helix domain-containing protein [Mycoplasmatota bacterium]|nr:helix-turn-helix domain-containing protein [Mycoplasmatota bacterium]